MRACVCAAPRRAGELRVSRGYPEVLCGLVCPSLLAVSRIHVILPLLMRARRSLPRPNQGNFYAEARVSRSLFPVSVVPKRQ